ncbi:hypothetical protein M413DRAFT_447569 [Hebeloma cylindrosporum]|uniref:Uncharacterized protein n=1 Tax=Hebeloma cylindrosporum TaxID=76867 RepID=A0A0C2YCX5_HEBCY|nr:hypothetical protein M413DRAFT_447569 [Hebeloma cylindrosporum h7]
MKGLHFFGQRVLVLFTVLQLSLFVAAIAPPLLRGLSRPETVKRIPEADSANLLTNAARLRAGLTPLKPRSVVTPTRVTARNPGTSALPVNGEIKVKTANGDLVGYVSRSLGAHGYGIASGRSDRMSISFKPKSLFKIDISGSPYPYLGFNGGDLGGNKNLLTASNPTGRNSVPLNVGNSLGGKSETTIWSYDSGTKSLIAQWINADGSTPSTRFWYYPNIDAIGVVHDSPSQGFEVLLSVAV